MTEYEIVIHLRESDEPARIPLPGVSADDAEADRQALRYEIEQARLAEVPIVMVQTKSGHPASTLNVDPHEVTEIDLVELLNAEE